MDSPDPTLDIVTPEQIQALDDLFALPVGPEDIIHLEEDEDRPWWSLVEDLGENEKVPAQVRCGFQRYA